MKALFLILATGCSIVAERVMAADDAAVLREYLGHHYPSKIEAVKVSADSVTVSGIISGEKDGVYLMDMPMEHPIGDPGSLGISIPLSPEEDGKFTLSLPRKRTDDGYTHDRLLTRWELVRKRGDAFDRISHGRHADEISCRAPDLPPAAPKNKKGLGGWSAGRIDGELAELEISSVTVNMMIHSLVSLEPGDGLVPFEWQGRTYHAREAVLREFDRSFLEAAKQNAMVSVILLVANPAKDTNPVVKVLGHSSASPEGIFSMPAVTTREGIALYGAILNLIAERWSRPDGKHGRVHHWIMHNEVDAGWVWTNAGEQSDFSYMSLYHRSMRMADLISRQYDPGMRPFISLTHHWAERGEPRWYGSKRMLELLDAYAEAEGDFPWGLAYHPYPQDLFNPRTWEDQQAKFDFNTPKITPRNLEVLDAYMKQPDMLYRGKTRPVHLSENGFNSRDYSEKSLEDQAAGMAMAWKKIEALSTVEAWQYHNWIDNRGEGGLKIGLRKFPDEPSVPLGKKPIWHLYKALATPAEDEASKPFLKTIGLSSWSETIHRAPIR